MNITTKLTDFIDLFKKEGDNTSFNEDHSTIINELVEYFKTETKLTDLYHQDHDLFFSLVESGAVATLVMSICNSYHGYYNLIEQEQELVTYIRKSGVISLEDVTYLTPSYASIKAYISQLKEKSGSNFKLLCIERDKHASREDWVKNDPISFIAAFELNLLSKIESKNRSQK